MNGLNWQALQLPLAAGLGQRFDDRARPAPFLDVATDVQFDEVGGIQTRYPFAALGDAFADADIRRIYANEDELLVFTKDKLYARNSLTGGWTEAGTHLAIKTSETARFATTRDQTDCDRAELNGVILYVWMETMGAGWGATRCFAAACESATGALLMPPTQIPDAMERCRVIALSSVFLVLYADSGGGLSGLAVAPDDLAADIIATDTTIIAAAAFNSYYDAVKIPSADSAFIVARHDTTASFYNIRKVTSALAISSATPGRACDGPIAVSVDPTGATAQVIRANGTNILGDRITVSSLADAATGQAVGTVASTPVNHISAAHRSTQDSGQYRCYAFWTFDATTDPTVYAWQCEHNWVDTGGTLGTQAIFKRRTGIATRAFDYEGHVYFWMVFAVSADATGIDPISGIQNVYFLYRDDGLLCASAADRRASGYVSDGYLPGVAGSAGVYSWCGGYRRSLVTSSPTGTVGLRAPLDVTFSFDSNEARRVARLGSTLYVSGDPRQWDGSELTEVGFRLWPWIVYAENASGTGITGGDYGVKASYEWTNGRGEVERSASVISATVTLVADDHMDVHYGGAFGPGGVPNLNHTLKTSTPLAVQIWRTTANPTADSAFYLSTSRDPASIGNNCYIENDAATVTIADIASWTDALPDADLSTHELHHEDGGILENLPPPSHTIVVASDTRLFLAGVAGDLDRVWYSKTRSEGEIAAFNDALAVDIPLEGGAITALAFLNETLIVFRERATYAMQGDGYDNLGGGNNYGPARLLSGEVGAVSQEAVCLTDGGLVFKSLKGWMLLNRGWAVDYIGAPVADYDDDTVVSVHVMPARHQVRCLTTSRMLVFDTVAKQWGEWSISNAVHGAAYQGVHVYASTSQVYSESSSYSALTYGMDVETSWIKLADLQGAARVRAIQILGEYRSTHHLRIRVAYNYDSTYVDDEYWTPSPTTVGGPLQVRFGNSRQTVQAIKVRITAVDVTHATVPTGEALKLTGLALEVGTKPGMWRQLPKAQRQ